jgi:hypothetical protein
MGAITALLLVSGSLGHCESILRLQNVLSDSGLIPEAAGIGKYVVMVFQEGPRKGKSIWIDTEVGLEVEKRAEGVVYRGPLKIDFTLDPAAPLDRCIELKFYYRSDGSESPLRDITPSRDYFSYYRRFEMPAQGGAPKRFWIRIDNGEEEIREEELRITDYNSIDQISKLLSPQVEARIRRLACWLLTGFREASLRKKAFPALVTALKDPDREVRSTAVNGLISVGDRRAVQHLKEALKREQDDSLRKQMQHAIKELAK